ncbi:hypothetical protein MTO96_047172 [Rhipicephalus appendiculatus]
MVSLQFIENSCMCSHRPGLPHRRTYPRSASKQLGTSASAQWAWKYSSDAAASIAILLYRAAFRSTFPFLGFIGFFVWDNLTGTAQVLVIPAANDRGIYPLSRMTAPLFRCEATETFCASWPRITAVLLFPATKSTDASSSASRKGCCWKILHHF